MNCDATNPDKDIDFPPPPPFPGCLMLLIFLALFWGVTLYLIFR